MNILYVLSGQRVYTWPAAADRCSLCTIIAINVSIIERLQSVLSVLCAMASGEECLNFHALYLCLLI